jgi:hypothetical protein
VTDLTTTPPKLTKAQRRALIVLAAQHHKGRSGRVSNTTDLDEGHVYWLSAEWLIGAGLAKPLTEVVGRQPSSVYLRITDTGLEALGASWHDELAAMRAAARAEREERAAARSRNGGR